MRAAIGALLTICCADCTRSPSQPSRTDGAMLTIRLADACPAIFQQRAFVFDGFVHRTGGSIEFTLPNATASGPNTGDMILRIADDSATGVLRSHQSRDGAGYVIAVAASNSADSVAVTAARTINGVSGTFDGVVSVAHYTFSLGDRCDAAGSSYRLSEK